MVGLLLFGVALGPHVLGFFGEHRPIADFFAELGKLLLMFSAGLEIDIALFRKAQARSIIFGLFTTTVPLLFGTLLGLGFGYALIPAIVVGSLLASHTLLRQSTARYRTIRRGSSWNSLAKPCSSRASLSSPVW